MKKDTQIDISEERSYYVAKRNEIVQKARYELSIKELKLLAFLISKVKPNDKPGLEYEFTVKSYCEVCGIEYASGANYKEIKDTLKALRDKSFWVKKPDGSETTVGWLGNVTIQRRSGKITVKFDDTLQEYITELYKDYTQYSLFSTLAFSSAYSFRIYELLKSYQFKAKHFNHTFDIDILKEQLMAPYKNFKDFRCKVLEVATKEINEYSDIEVTWEPVTKGRKVVEVKFDVLQRDSFGAYAAYDRVNKKLDGGMTGQIRFEVSEDSNNAEGNTIRIIAD